MTLKSKHTLENLTGWRYGKKLLSGFYGYNYMADTWPERLGIEDIAALQAAGKEYPVFEAWKICLTKATEGRELAARQEQWFLGSDERPESLAGKELKLKLIPPCHKHQGADISFFTATLILRDTISPVDFADYLQKVNEQPSRYIAAWFDAFGIETIIPEQQAEAVPVTQINELEPWLIADPKDPPPKHDWFTPARYFARQLVIDEPTLLAKRHILASKVACSLINVDIKGRGKKKLDPSTILKAFSNITFN